MEAILVLIVLAALAALVALPNLGSLVVYEHERGLSYRNGVFRGLLAPGRYFFWRNFEHIAKLDTRSRFVSLLGQEVLSADNVSIRISLAARYNIADPHRAVMATADFPEALHLMIQIAMRDYVGSLPVDELLAKRKEAGEALLAAVKPQAADIGLGLEIVGIKDVMFPGELKNIFAQVVNARNEGLAALERARGEIAALRNLANAAKVLENNPALLQLRILQAFSAGSHNTLVLKVSDEEVAGIMPQPASGQTP